jgi:hypothetical protein
MTRRILQAAALAMVLAAASPAAATETVVWRSELEGRQAQAAFVGGSGCLRTVAAIRGIDGRISVPGEGMVRSAAMVFVTSYDVCVGRVVLSAATIVPLTRDAFRIDRRLRSASLNARCVATDLASGREVPIRLRVEWTGVGAKARVRDRRIVRAAGFVVADEFDLVRRLASASGSVTVGGFDLTPAPAIEAEMDRVRHESIAVRA